MHEELRGDIREYSEKVCRVCVGRIPEERGD